MSEFYNNNFYKEILGENYSGVLENIRTTLSESNLNIIDARLVLRNLANDLDYFSVVGKEC